MTPAEITSLIVTVAVALAGFMGMRAIFGKLDELGAQVARLANEIGGQDGLRERQARIEAKVEHLDDSRSDTPRPFLHYRG